MAPGGFGRVLLPLVALLAFFFVVTMLLGSVFGGLGIGILVACACTGGLVGILAWKFRSMRRGTTVRFSESGVRLDDAKGFRIQLAWPDVVAVDQVDSRMVGTRVVGIRGSKRVGAGAVHSLGLVGWGERVVPDRIPEWMREQLASQPTKDGRDLVAIPLGALDPNWTSGQMGAWVRRCRPDLL